MVSLAAALLVTQKGFDDGGDVDRDAHVVQSAQLPDAIAQHVAKTGHQNSVKFLQDLDETALAKVLLPYGLKVPPPRRVHF